VSWDELAEELARFLAGDDAGIFTDPRFAGAHWDNDREIHRLEGQRVLKWLAERGRLLPDGAHTEERDEWFVWDQPPGHGLTVTGPFEPGDTDVEPEQMARGWATDLPHAQIKRRTITTITMPWVAVDGKENGDG
jgi:hypothetical protein